MLKCRASTVVFLCLLLVANGKRPPGPPTPPPPTPPPPTLPPPSTPPPSTPPLSTPTLPPPPPTDTTTEYPTTPSCPTSCDCSAGTTVLCNGDDADPTITTLSFANMQLTEVPGFVGLYQEITTIDLRENLIDHIGNRQFSSLNFPNLQFLILSDNVITSVHPDGFQVPSLQYLDLSSNFLGFFDLAAIRSAGSEFTTLMLTNNEIADFVNVEAPFFARDRFPFLSIFVADNRIDCNAAYLNILCRGFLASDGATCIDYGMSEYNTEPLDSVCDACCRPAPTNGNTASESESTTQKSTEEPEASVVILGSALGGALGIIPLILITTICISYCRYKKLKRRSVSTYGRSRVMTLPPQVAVLPAPVSQGTSLALQGTSFASLASQRTSMTRYVDQPFHTLQIGVKSTNCQDDDNGENLYEAVGPRPLPALPEEDYEPNGYICRVDSIPGSKPAPLEKQAAIEIEPILEEEEEEVERDKDAGPTTTANEKEDVTSEGEDACSRIVTTNNGDGTTPKSLTEDGGMIGTKLGNDTEVEPDLAYVQVVL